MWRFSKFIGHLTPISGVFRFDITENKKVVKTWTADLKNGDGSLVEGEGTKPDVTIIVADADFVQLAAGKLDAQKGRQITLQHN